MMVSLGEPAPTLVLAQDETAWTHQGGWRYGHRLG
jgi:hypothetical protein